MDMEKRYRWFLFFLPPLLFLIYFSTHLHHWLRLAYPPRSISTDLTQHHMLQAELQSLALLQRQADELLRLWNAASNSSEGQTLKGEIMSQLRLNSQVQQTLLSPHQNRSALRSGSVTYPALDAFPTSCQVAESKKNAVKKRLAWKPKANRYLMVICTSGQFSNHLICIEKHMFLAALLDRTLVLPHPKVDVNYERVLNISHIQNCLGGNNTVIAFDDFNARRKGNLHVNRFLCYMHDCYLDREHEEALKGVGLSWGKKEDAWPESANENNLSHLDAAEFVKKFACDDEVIGIGDVFYANVEDEWVRQTGGPLSHTCQSVIKPHNFILATAERFIQTFLGRNFLALHFRRYGFLTFCNENSKRGQNCFFYPIPQAAECILRKIRSSAALVIYLSTDAQESETSLLQSLLVRNGVTVPLVQRPKHDKGEKWDSPLSRHGVIDDKEVIGMLDKTICAMAATFIGTPGSTFTDDILRMRREWGTENTCDEYLCQGEAPNFIADMH